MQIDVNPMPATGDMMTAEASPAVSPPTAEIQPDGSGNGSGGPGSQKGFRETMDDLLRSTESGAVNGDAHATSSTPDVSEEPVAEAALLEITGIPLGPQQKARAGFPLEDVNADQVGKGAPQEAPTRTGQIMPSQIERSQVDLTPKGEGDASTPATGNGNAASGSFEFLKSSVQGEAPEHPKPSVQGEATGSPKPSFQGEPTAFPKDSVKSQVATDGVTKGTVIDPKVVAEPNVVAEPKVGAEPKVAADLKTGAQLQAVSASKVNTAPVEATSLSESQAAFLNVSRSGSPQAKTAKNGASQAQTDSDAKASQRLGDTGRAPQAHANSGQQAALNAATAARATPMEAPTEVKEGSSQGFATLVESIEKGGADTKPMNLVSENPLDAVGTSGGKHSPNTQSATANIAKADPAMPQPLPKEEVIQQIVDSAKLRFQNGQSEMRIQLKPESMGHVRLHISTDQQQVMVKVVAELPMVKQLLESNLPQLRSELQGQGLEIDKFDVSVGGDHESQNKEQQTWTQRQNGRRGGGTFAQGDPENPDEPRDSQHHGQPQAERETDGVDYFA